MADDYVCTLDSGSLKVAREELHEDPKERMSQVETFRQWIKDQKHITAPTDTTFLLKFLRTAKFSQLRAREVLEGYLKNKVRFPNWVNDIDTTDPAIHEFLRTGYGVPIPYRDAKGRRILMVNEGAFAAESKKYTVDTALRSMMAMTFYMNMDENTLVNGYVFFEDFSHFSIKHMSFWGMDTMKKMPKLWENNIPGRFKAFHFYNPGPIFETMMSVCKPLFSKKMQDRFFIHGKNMEDIHKHIPQEYFPEEYLPDDYKGKSPGTIQQIIEGVIQDFKTTKVRDLILHETNSKWTYDMTLKSDDPSASFRKLNVD